MLKNDVEAIAKSEGRLVGTDSHDLARDYIVDRLQTIGAKPYKGASLVLPYDSNGLDFFNIVGSIPGSNPELDPILLGAHYDTCGATPGADDNAAAVAILLSTAEKLVEAKHERTTILAFFDAEEPPFFLNPTKMGSIRLYNDHGLNNVHIAIIMDLVGHDVPVPNLEDLLFITGMESDPGLQSIIRGVEPERGLRTVPTLNSYLEFDLSDHHIFRVHGHPYLLLTCGRWEHYHSVTDTPDKLNYQKMNHIRDYVLTLIAQIAVTSLLSPSRMAILESVHEYDTLQTELHFLKKNIQPILAAFGQDMDLRSRGDIDKLVALLLQNFDL
jgi:hypothetical protein